MTHVVSSWQVWAILSAGFAAITAIFAKVGVEGISSNFATFVRTAVVMVALALILTFTDGFQSLSTLSRKSLMFLGLSGLATGASWLCYFHALQLGKASQVAPVDKLSVVLVAVFAAMCLSERLSAANWVGIGLVTLGAMLMVVKG